MGSVMHFATPSVPSRAARWPDNFFCPVFCEHLFLFFFESGGCSDYPLNGNIFRRDELLLPVFPCLLGYWACPPGRVLVDEHHDSFPSSAGGQSMGFHPPPLKERQSALPFFFIRFLAGFFHFLSSLSSCFSFPFAQVTFVAC